QTRSILLEHNKTTMVAVRPAERAYLEIPSRDGKTVTVRGITIFKSQPGNFVFAELLCDRSRFEKARVAYEDTLTTLSIPDPSAAPAPAAEKRAPPAQPAPAPPDPPPDENPTPIAPPRPARWERLYTPASDGSEKNAVEIGYRRVQTGFGRRSQFSQFGEGGGD